MCECLRDGVESRCHAEISAVGRVFWIQLAYQPVRRPDHTVGHAERPRGLLTFMDEAVAHDPARVDDVGYLSADQSAVERGVETMIADGRIRCVDVVSVELGRRDDEACA